MLELVSQAAYGAKDLEGPDSLGRKLAGDVTRDELVEWDPLHILRLSRLPSHVHLRLRYHGRARLQVLNLVKQCTLPHDDNDVQVGPVLGMIDNLYRDEDEVSKKNIVGSPDLDGPGLAWPDLLQ